MLPAEHSVQRWGETDDTVQRNLHWFDSVVHHPNRSVKHAHQVAEKEDGTGRERGWERRQSMVNKEKDGKSYFGQWK